MRHDSPLVCMVGISYVYINMIFLWVHPFFLFFIYPSLLLSWMFEHDWTHAVFGVLCMSYVILYLHLLSAVEHDSHEKALKKYAHYHYYYYQIFSHRVLKIRKHTVQHKRIHGNQTIKTMAATNRTEQNYKRMTAATLTVDRVFVVDDEHSVTPLPVRHYHCPLVDRNLLTAAQDAWTCTTLVIMKTTPIITIISLRRSIHGSNRSIIMNTTMLLTLHQEP